MQEGTYYKYFNSNLINAPVIYLLLLSVAGVLCTLFNSATTPSLRSDVSLLQVFCCLLVATLPFVLSSPHHLSLFTSSNR